jgi:hypothetical protein
MRNVVGPPVRGGDFYDREETVNLLWERLETGNILLAAPRRFGKTSLMYQLLDAPAPNWRPVHLDAESISEPANFIIALLEALWADKWIRGRLLPELKKAGQWIKEHVPDLEASPDNLDVSFRLKLKETIAPEWKERGQAFLQTLRGLGGKTRLLIIVDELPVMLHLFRDNDISDAETRAFLYWFRKIRTDPRVGLTDCRFLIGGSIGIEHYLSRLNAADSFNDFERLGVEQLGPSRGADFLARLLRARRLRLSAISQRKVLSLIGAPIPYFIQVFVAEIATAWTNGQRRIGPKALEEIYEHRLLGAACKTYFQHYYDRLRHYEPRFERTAKALLRQLALDREKGTDQATLRAVWTQTVGESVPNDEFGCLIGDLENDFYIQFRPETETYAFASKILCDWWRRYHAL